jgi:hypothetical protein
MAIQSGLNEENLELELLPVGEREVVVQFIDKKTGTRSEVFASTLSKIADAAREALSEKNHQDDLVLILMDKLYRNQEDLEFSSCPIMSVAYFADTFCTKEEESLL